MFGLPLISSADFNTSGVVLGNVKQLGCSGMNLHFRMDCSKKTRSPTFTTSTKTSITTTRKSSIHSDDVFAPPTPTGLSLRLPYTTLHARRLLDPIASARQLAPPPHVHGVRSHLLLAAADRSNPPRSPSQRHRPHPRHRAGGRDERPRCDPRFRTCRGLA